MASQEDDDIIICDSDEPGRNGQGQSMELPPRFMKLPNLVVGDLVYGLERGLTHPWREARIVKIESIFSKTCVRLKFIPGEKIGRRKHRIGRTVLSRYLIFFDDGFVSYCEPEDIRLTCFCEAPANVWSEVHPNIQMFIKSYVRRYPEIQLAKTQQFSLITVEWNGQWWTARVKKVDCSIVTVELTANGITFSIWRGSPRILSLLRQQRTSKIPRYIMDSNVEYEGNVVKHGIPVEALGECGVSQPHECRQECSSRYKGSLRVLSSISPLLVPLYHGWERGIESVCDKTQVFYKTPCGVKMTELEQIQAFVLKLKCPYGMDSFCLVQEIDCLDEFKPSQRGGVLINDISNGLNNSRISSVNGIDAEFSPYIEYTDDVLANPDVILSTDPEFMVCCDCQDGCLDRAKCACYHLTFEYHTEYLIWPMTCLKGYQYRRLFDRYDLGLYECNKRCSCNQNCTNRVVQNKTQWQLQVFKTRNKGFAVRALQDIPRGSFVCTYSGNLLTSEKADELEWQGNHGFLTDLDYIEMAEKHKEGYEASILRLPEGQSKRRKINPDIDLPSLFNSEITKSRTRELFGSHENAEIFVIDSSSVGNVSRYFSHSCDPNLFVQQVFYKTHDIRFPTVAFFTSRNIKCGDELTWNYCYNVDEARGKSVDCHCGVLWCRGNLF